MYNLLKNKRLILTLPLFLAASLLLPLNIVPMAHASPGTGLVCITASTSATSCPTSAPSLGPFNVGDTFSVGVFAQASDAMGGFDVFVASNPAYVSPVSAALGPLIASPSLTSICINGSAQTGACTTGSANGPGVVEVTTIESSGGNECGGISPCSGMAFTITYQVVGATPTTSLSYPTNAGCSNSSVSSPPNTCVLIADAFGTTLPENIQGASVTIALPNAIVCITNPATATSCNVGRPQIPVVFGSTYTFGVRVQNSQPLSGFSIYVAVNRQYLNPLNATLGPLIPSPDPSLTIICVNDISVVGSCTPNSANGPGVVEVQTADSSGSNVCPATPCSGLAFTITYQVVGVTPTTPGDYPTNAACSVTSVASPPNECVEVLDNVGTTVPENIQGADVIQTHPVDNSTILKSCSPNPVVVGQPTSCVVTISDPSTSSPVAPIGAVTWQSSGSGSFNPSTCQLQAINSFQSQCSTTYTPTHVGTGTTAISVIYGGDTIHSGGTDPFNVNVNPASAALSSVPINDQTGSPVDPAGVPQGIPVHDQAIMIAGTGFPVEGACSVPGTCTLTYTWYSGGVCSGTGTLVGVVTIRPANDVPGSPSVTLSAPTSPTVYSFNAVYNNDTLDNNRVSSCTSFTVLPAPHFTAGKLHWTHHLSLSKSASTQSWTAIVVNPLSSSVKLVVRIVGISTTNPGNSFDVTCGVTCVNTASGGVNATPGLTPVTVGAGVSTSFSFNQIVSGFNNEKVSFTATLFYATGTIYTHSDSKSGAFAVVP